jgi:hypothetical protein
VNATARISFFPVIVALSALVTLQARAGMTVYDLNDIVRVRLEDISFFAVALLVGAFGIKLLWNHLARGLPNWPRLSFTKAMCLTTILSLLMLLVLSMISGARELLTPGAWRRQGSAYRLNDPASEPLRRQSMEFLRAALWNYAAQHGGKFPAHDFQPEISEKLWQSPDSVGTRYIYVGGFSKDVTNALVVCEPVDFGDERLALFSDGRILKLPTSSIRQAMGIKEHP